MFDVEVVICESVMFFDVVVRMVMVVQCIEDGCFSVCILIVVFG